MSWSTLKDSIASVIYANSNQEITGPLMQEVLNAIINSIGENATLGGVATTTTAPGAPDGSVFYFAFEPGVYPNFDRLEITDEVGIFVYIAGKWSLITTGMPTKGVIEQRYELIYNGANPGNAITVSGTTVSIKPDGFGINYRNKIYYIAATDTSRTSNYTFTLDGYNQFLVIDTTKLTNVGGRNDISAVIKKVNYNAKLSDTIAMFYRHTNADTLVPVGKFNDYFTLIQDRTELSYKEQAYSIINNITADAMSAENNVLSIKPSGFGFVYKGNIYYIAATDTSRTADYTFTFSAGQILAVDTTKLTNVGARNELSNVLVNINAAQASLSQYVPIAYMYQASVEEPIKLFDKFADLFTLYKKVDDSIYRELKYELLYNITTAAITIKDNTLSIKPSGFGINYKNNIYYVAAVDTLRTEDYTFTFSAGNAAWLVIDTSNLTNVGGRNELSNVLRVINSVNTNLTGYIPIAYFYPQAETPILLDKFFDLYGNKATINTGPESSGGLEYDLLYNNNPKAFSISGTTVNIKPTGFGLKYKGQVYYIANTDATITTDYTFNFDNTNAFLAIDTSKLTNPGVRNELSDVVKKVNSGANLEGYIPILYAYSYVEPAYIKLLDKFADLFEADALGGDSDAAIPEPRYDLLYNITASTFELDGNTLHIKPSGFGIKYNGKTYYVANPDTTATDDYTFTFDNFNGFLVIDPTKLVNAGARNELTSVIKKVQSTTNLTNYIPILYAYTYTTPGSITFLHKFKDLYSTGGSAGGAGVTNRVIREDIQFNPDFYAYLRGRYNDANGQGTSWYKRFTIAHVSDTHQYNDLVKEAVSVVSDRVNVLINTGDDANGRTSNDAAEVKANLTTTAKLWAACKVPYLQASGNHDVTGLTKAEFHNIVGSTVKTLTPSFVWGNETDNKGYGYIDFTNNAYQGNYRIIVLDPHDCLDNQSGSTYEFQSVIFSQAQINWLIETLLDAVEKDLNVFTMMHYSFGDSTIFNDEYANPDAIYYQDPFMIPDIIDAIQNKATLNKTYNDIKDINNIILNRNFSGLTKSIKYIVHLFGHIHSKNHYRCQKSDGSKQYNMLMLGEAALGTYGNALNKAYRDPGTVNEIAFSVLAVDDIEQCVYRMSYGSFLNYDKTNSCRTLKIPYNYSKVYTDLNGINEEDLI